MIPTWEGATSLQPKPGNPLPPEPYFAIYPTFAVLFTGIDKSISLKIMGSFSSLALSPNGGAEYLGTVYVTTEDTKKLYYLANLGTYGGEVTLDQFTEVTYFDGKEVLRVRTDYRSYNGKWVVDAIDGTVLTGYFGYYNSWAETLGPTFGYYGTDHLSLHDSKGIVYDAIHDAEGRFSGFCIPNKMKYVDIGYVPTSPGGTPSSTANVWGKSLRMYSSPSEAHLVLWDGTTLHKTVITTSVYVRYVAISNEVCIITYTDNTYYLYRYNAATHVFEKDVAFNPSDNTLPSALNFLGICEGEEKAIVFSGTVPYVMDFADGAITILPSIPNLGSPNQYAIQRGAGKPYFVYAARYVTPATSYAVINLHTNVSTVYTPDLSSKIAKLTWLSLSSGDAVDYLYCPSLYTLSTRVYARVKAHTNYGATHDVGFIIYEPDPDTGELIEIKDTLDRADGHSTYYTCNQHTHLDEDIFVEYANPNTMAITDLSGDAPFSGYSHYVDLAEHFLFSLKGPDGKRVSFVNETFASQNTYIQSKFTTRKLPRFSETIQVASADGYYIFLVQGIGTRYVIVFSRHLSYNLVLCQNFSLSHRMYDQFNDMHLDETIEYSELDHVPFGFREIPEAVSISALQANFVTVALASGRAIHLCLEDFLV